MRSSTAGLVLFAMVAVTTTALLVAEEPATREPIHAGRDVMEPLVTEVVLALMRHDTEAARKALDGLEKSCRRLNPEESEMLGPKIRASDKALHVTLDRAREYSGKGGAKAAFVEFFYVQDACRTCHVNAVEKGLLPAEGPLW